jgi:hypothetical protein
MLPTIVQTVGADVSKATLTLISILKRPRDSAPTPPPASPLCWPGSPKVLFIASSSNRLAPTITAVMRKLTILANVILREQRSWTPKTA